jgi:site-specific DNA recombinase
VEELIQSLVVDALDDPGLPERIASRNTGPDDDELFTQAAADERKLEELAEAWADGELSRAEWKAARDRVEARLQATRSALGRRRGTTGVDEWVGRGDALLDAWADLPQSRVRAVVSGLIDRVEVGPAVRGRNRFDPSRFTIHWRY